MPADYKEVGEFKTAQPRDEIAKGKWWEIYQDTQLSALEEQIAVSNQTLKAAPGTISAGGGGSSDFSCGSIPTVTGAAAAAHYSQSPNRPLNGSVANYQDNQIPVDVSNEPDLWGRVRRSVEASRSAAQASAADLANVNLSLQELKLHFSLRGQTPRGSLDSTVDSYESLGSDTAGTTAALPRQSTWRKRRLSWKPHVRSTPMWESSGPPTNTRLLCW